MANVKDASTKCRSSSVSLFLGEGNFSFSASLARSKKFRSLNTTLIATDFVPELEDDINQDVQRCTEGKSYQTEKVELKRGSCPQSTLSLLKENVSRLKSLSHAVLLDVDATKIHENCKLLKMCRGAPKIFVIFNFPHVKSKKMKIGLNRDLLKNFFISCDRLTHILNENQHDDNTTEVVPIVSLCAGQCGIPEVDRIHRAWGDSWQINDMAAYGNFVCVSICKFDEWDLYTSTKSMNETEQDTFSSGESGHYASCYYRLQGSVGFTTEDALTFTFQHRPHINPQITDRLHSILFASEAGNFEGVQAFLQIFSPILDEKLIYSNENYEKTKRRFIHIVVTPANEIDSVEHKIRKYINSGSESSPLQLQVKAIDNRICIVKTSSRGEDKVIVTGAFSGDKESIEVYADILLEMRHGRDYRDAYGQQLGKSLYPRTHEFHVSFWMSVKFSLDSFMETLLDVYGLMLKEVDLVEEYANDQGRKSLCWHVKVESLDLPLSAQCAHQMYLTLRQQLAQRLDVEVR